MVFDASVLSVALITISEKLQGTAIEAFWSVTSFLLASAIFQPTVAALSDIFGRAYVRLPNVLMSPAKSEPFTVLTLTSVNSWCISRVSCSVLVRLWEDLLAILPFS
jgi:MFS family permease